MADYLHGEPRYRLHNDLLALIKNHYALTDYNALESLYVLAVWLVMRHEGFKHHYVVHYFADLMRRTGSHHDRTIFALVDLYNDLCEKDEKHPPISEDERALYVDLLQGDTGKGIAQSDATTEVAFLIGQRIINRILTAKLAPGTKIEVDPNMEHGLNEVINHCKSMTMLHSHGDIKLLRQSLAFAQGRPLYMDDGELQASDNSHIDYRRDRPDVIRAKNAQANLDRSQL